ncbi:unnamed protein product (macronuclear) [Paramecium tetraurelia]|uniref:Protein kinase domain-containing protein n=1 Tax=Paramecium tetraurelia TaxID=5888 RepID=A0C7N8_PARTE|nr:uncharacterized protein GSPATT00035935001 [Paramecium tetraurelia]CAK66805.1 unnamed protein product [Paramecium tetraurelia]|eukprot:XP_001434202.1 hypothetical protein (macronuclear) [Paramecium tetraurelia strain d4-2]
MQKHPILPINTPRDATCPIQYQSTFRKQNEAATPTLNTMNKKTEIPRAPSAMNNKLYAEQTMMRTKQYQSDQQYLNSIKGSLSNCNSNKSRGSKNSTGFEQVANIFNETAQQNQSSNIRISHFHTNTAPVNLYEQKFNDEMFLLKDQDTGTVYDIRQVDKIQVNKEYMAKLKKRHKSAWQGWWQQKRENNHFLILNVKQNNIKEIEKLLEIPTKDLKPEINIKDDNGFASIHYSCLNQNYDLSLLLLKNEADCDSINAQGQTPLIICAQNGCDSIATLLLTIGSDINHIDNHQNTALHYACLFCINKHIRIAEILLARPSLQLNQKNLDNKSPVELIQNNSTLKNLIEKHYRVFVGLNFFKMKKESFNQCHKVQIYDDSKDQQKVNSPTSKQQYYLTNQYQQTSKCYSPYQTDNQFSTSNRSTLNQVVIDEMIGPLNIRIILQIGKGSFGDVYLVEKRNQSKTAQGQKYAMKVLPKSKFLGHNLIRYAMAERNILSYLNHPYIVKLRFAFQTNTHLCLLMDFCPGGDLSKIIQNQKRIPEQAAKLYIAEILTALEHLHKNDIIYRDLKPENIVIDTQGHAMLTDFGLSKEGVRDNYGAKSFCGSMAYLAPEMLKRVGHGRAVDWYHLGILLYEMISGKPPYFSPNRDEMLNNIECNKITFPDNISKECKSIIQSLLEKNPMIRLGASSRDADEIKDHPFFRQINWDDLLQKKYKPPQPIINQEILNQKFDIPFDFILSADKSSSINYINGWSFINNDFSQI